MCAEISERRGGRISCERGDVLRDWRCLRLSWDGWSRNGGEGEGKGTSVGRRSSNAKAMATAEALGE